MRQSTTVGRFLLLGLMLAGYGRLLWALDAKALWWDESLSVQRAEQALWPLLLGRLTMFDGTASLSTIDQHPFFYFLLQGVLMRLAGQSEFVLRFVSVMAATLLVPTLWTCARWLTRRDLFPPSTPYWAALFGAASPFFLWYGQEARPYALWSLLTLLATYALLAAVAAPTRRGWIGYGLLLFMLLTTHYYAVFVLPIHAAIVLFWLRSRNWRLAAALAGALLLVGGLIGALAVYLIVIRQGGGANFPRVGLRMLAPDLLNAFSLGLSVAIDRVWWLDLLFGGLVLTGGLWAMRSWRAVRRHGWVPVALVIVPALAVLLLNVFHPVYMNARHLSLIGGGFLLLLAGGLGVVTAWQRWVGMAIALLLLAGIGYSTVNYFTQEEYAKDDFYRLGDYLNERIMPGDLVVLKPPFSWRHFAYYAPNANIIDPAVAAKAIKVVAMPQIDRSWDASAELLATLTAAHPRTWFLVSGTHPYADIENRVDSWLDEHLYRLDETTFFSHSSLKAKLYLPSPPVLTGNPSAMDTPVDVWFGDQIRLAGVDVGPYTDAVTPLPVTLYWQTDAKTDRRYKYSLRLEEVASAGDVRTVALTEREPYDGAIPTIFWDPGVTVVEYSALPPSLSALSTASDRFRLALQIYDAETLEKLPVTAVGVGTIADDGVTALLPFAPRSATGNGP